MTIEEAIKDAEEVLVSLCADRNLLMEHVDRELDYAVEMFSNPTMMPEARLDKMLRWEKQETRHSSADMTAINYAIAFWRQHLIILEKIAQPASREPR